MPNSGRRSGKERKETRTEARIGGKSRAQRDEVGPSPEELKLRSLALIKRRNDGSYNTFASQGDGWGWRISKGRDRASRKRHLSEWLEEAALGYIFAAVGAGPAVDAEYTAGTWLTDKDLRVATHMAEYTEDLFEGFSDPKGAKVYIGASASLGKAAGDLLVRRICTLGAVCVLHGDTKPENVLLLFRSRGRQEFLQDLRFTDFDPQFLFVGCDCLAGALKGLGPRALAHIEAMPGALFSILNLILFWTWFEVDAELDKRRRREPAIIACHEALTSALTRSSFPLDLVGPNLPTQLKDRMAHWTKLYRDKKLGTTGAPLWQVAARTFPGLQGSRYDWKRGPKVAGLQVVDAAHSCCEGQADGRCDFDVGSARAKLKSLAAKVAGMGC